MDISKKMAAAVAAVTTYIKAEEEMLAMQAVAARTPLPEVRLWGTSARRDMMQLRGMMQLRTFNGSNLRSR